MATTGQGRAVSVVAIIVGFYSYTTLVAMIAESVHSFTERKSRGTARVKARDHIVVCEYTAIADELIQSLPRVERFQGRDMVVVSDLVSSNPYPDHSFVRGVPINPDTLRRACVDRAAFVFIFANLRFVDPDLKTLHIASRVRKLNPGAKIFVELTQPDSDLVQKAHGDFVIVDSRKLVESVLQDRPIDPTEWN